MNQNKIQSIFCVFDNPETFRREYWRDGKLLASIDARLFLEKNRLHFVSLIKAGFPICMDLGDWKTGQMLGVIDAIRPSQHD